MGHRMGTNQALALAGALTQKLPADLDQDVAKAWITSPVAITAFLEGLRSYPVVFPD